MCDYISNLASHFTNEKCFEIEADEKVHSPELTQLSESCG
jgi:hypothetical protein